MSRSLANKPETAIHASKVVESGMTYFPAESIFNLHCDFCSCGFISFAHFICSKEQPRNKSKETPSTGGVTSVVMNKK